jgi:hypothetical protein
MRLNNPQADEYLTRFASELQSSIEALPGNDDILEKLELLESFVYKAPAVALRVIDFVLSHPSSATTITTPLGEIEGRHHKDLVLKCLDLLSDIRYLDPDGVLERLVPLVVSQDETIGKKSKEVLRSFAKFDLNLLTKSAIGYGPQAKALEFVRRWPVSQRLENLDFVEVVLQEILGSSVEGTSMENPDSISIGFAPVQPNDFLKDIRRQTMELIYQTYLGTSNQSQQIRLVRVLQHAAHAPHMGPYGDDVAQMILDDTRVIIGIYRKMLFDDGDQLVGHAGLAHEIEDTLSFYEQDIPVADEARQLRSAILSDRFYQLFRLLVGADRGFAEGVSWEEAETSRSTDIDHKIDSIEASNLGQWTEDLNRIASQAEVIGGWEFRHFDYFLRSLGKRKPALALEILNDALEHDRALTLFAADLLEGFRDGGEVGIWDLAVEQIVRKGEPRYVSAIAWSLTINRHAELENEIRERDLSLIEDVVREQNELAFLVRCNEELPQLRSSLMNALARLYYRDQHRIEALIVSELDRHPEFKRVQLLAIHTGLLRGWIDCGRFSPEGAEFLKQWLIEFIDLDWNAQNLLLNIARGNLQTALDVFRERIKRHELLERSAFAAERYEAIPFNLNRKLTTYLSRHPELYAKISEWVENMTADHFRSSWNLSRFLSAIHATHKVQSALIEKGDDASLEKALALANPSVGRNIQLLMEIVRRTDNARILGEVSALLYSTGVVWGEDGIAVAWEGKKKILSKYLEDESERVRGFAGKMIKSLEESIKQERVRVAEDREIRRIEFEG